LAAADWLDGPLGVLLSPLGHLYAAGGRLRRAGYAKGLLQSHRPPLPTLSIGNLSSGGTGKTPLLFDALARLEAAGFRSGVLSRGYGGDEGRMLEERHPRVRLVEDADRVRGLAALLDADPPDVLLLDDGFQHHRLQRDLDVVLLDATRPFGRCIPAGLFREPAAALRRAELVVLARADLVDRETRARIWGRVDSARKGLPSLPRCEGTVRARDRRRLGDGAVENVAGLHGARGRAAAGIGNPQSFLRILEALGFTAEAVQFVPDHHAWSAADLSGWEREELVLVTEKDAVKLRAVLPADLALRVWELRVDWCFLAGEDAWQAALDDWSLPVRAARIEPLWQAHDPGPGGAPEGGK